MLTNDLPKLLENQKSYALIPECKFVVCKFQSIRLKNTFIKSCALLA